MDQINKAPREPGIMRSVITLIILLCSGTVGLAQQVNFMPSLQTAFDKAKQQHKMVFVEYYNAECPVCKKLEPVFADTALAGFYNENFTAYKLNTEHIKKEDSLFINKAGLRFESVPYFLFFDTDQQFVHYSGTKTDITYLINAGRTAMDKQERSGNLANKYNAGDRSIKTLYAYSNLLDLYKNDSLRKIIADELFKAYPAKDLGTEKSYIILKNCVTDIDNGFFRYWIGHIDEIKLLEKNAKSSHPVNVLGDIVQHAINSNERKNWDLAKIRSVKEMILQTEMSKDADAFFWEQESMLLVKENRNDEAMEIFKRRIANDSNVINSSVYTINYYLKLFSDNASLVTIKTFLDKLSMQKADKNEKAALMYSNILFCKRTGDKKKAKKLGTEALNYYMANKIDAVELNKLLAGI